jgi:putative transposase
MVQISATTSESIRQVSAALHVAPSRVVTWSQRFRVTESCTPAGTGGHPPRKIARAHEVWMLERVKAPFTLRSLVGELAGRGLQVDFRTVWAFGHRTGYSFKNKPTSPKNRTARM